jgi:hypothetical protein
MACRWVGDVADDGRAGGTHSGDHVCVLSIAMCRLIEVHEVEVDGVPRKLDIGLRVQVKQWLVESSETADPHLRRAKCVHPGDDA